MQAIIRVAGDSIYIKLCAETKHEQSLIDDNAEGWHLREFRLEASNYYSTGAHMSHCAEDGRVVYHYSGPVTLELKSFLRDNIDQA